MLLWIILSAKRTMEPALDPAAGDQKRERDHDRGPDNPPLSDTAGDSNAGREPTIRHCPTPQAMPRQATNQVHAALVSPRTRK